MSRISILFCAATLLTVLTACGPGTEIPPIPRVVVTTEPSVTTTVTVPSTTTVPTSASPPKATTKSSTPKTKAVTPSHSKAACLKDENQCYGPGTNLKCETGSCVDAARGMTENSIRAARDKWLRENPDWCPAGTQGAVAPCR